MIIKSLKKFSTIDWKPFILHVVIVYKASGSLLYNDDIFAGTPLNFKHASIWGLMQFSYIEHGKLKSYNASHF
jgi:hypothetical protein